MANMSQNSSVNIYEHPDIIAAQTPEWFHFTTGTVLLISTVISIIANGVVLYTFLVKDRRLLTRTNLYIVAICIFTIAMAILCIPMTVISCFGKEWKFGDAGCQYYAFIMTFCGLTLMLLFATISVDRYIFVVHSDLSSRLGKQYSIVGIILSVVVALGFSVCPLFGWNQYTYEGVGTSCAIDIVGEMKNGRSYAVTLLVIFFAIPVTVITIAYISVVIKVKGEYERHRVSFHRPVHIRQRMRKLKVELNLGITIILIIGLFLFCWSPLAVLLLLKIVDREAEFSAVEMTIPAIMTKVGGAFTPIVYVMRFSQFRKQVLGSFRRSSSVMPVHPLINRISVLSASSVGVAGTSGISHKSKTGIGHFLEHGNKTKTGLGHFLEHSNNTYNT